MVKRLRNISQAKENMNERNNSLAKRVEALSNRKTTENSYVRTSRTSLADKLKRALGNS